MDPLNAGIPEEMPSLPVNQPAPLFSLPLLAEYCLVEPTSAPESPPARTHCSLAAWLEQRAGGRCARRQSTVERPSPPAPPPQAGEGGGREAGGSVLPEEELHGNPALSRLLILNFWSAECPWSERTDQALLAWLAEWGRQVELWTIAANANEPDDLLQQAAAERGLPLMLDDRSGLATGLYRARTTPHLFVIDEHGILRYQGALDDVTFRQRTPTRLYLRQAVTALLAGQEPEPAQTPPYGCTIVRQYSAAV